MSEVSMCSGPAKPDPAGGGDGVIEAEFPLTGRVAFSLSPPPYLSSSLSVHGYLTGTMQPTSQGHGCRGLQDVSRRAGEVGGLARRSNLISNMIVAAIMVHRGLAGCAGHCTRRPKFSLHFPSKPQGVHLRGREEVAGGNVLG